MSRDKEWERLWHGVEDVSHGQWGLEERELRGLVLLLLPAESLPGPVQQVAPLGSKYDQNPGGGGQPVMNSQVWNSLQAWNRRKRDRNGMVTFCGLLFYFQGP